MQHIAEGKRGIVYLCIHRGKKAVKKVEKENNYAINIIQNEISWLKKLNRYKIGPKIYSSRKNYFVCEYVDGERIIPYIEKSKKPLEIIKKILKQCKTLDDLKVDKKEMNNPYKHIIVRKNQPIMIDFERARFSLKPSNVTGFFSFLTAGKIMKILDKKGIILDREKLKPLLQKYKKSYSDKYFRNLLRLI